MKNKSRHNLDDIPQLFYNSCIWELTKKAFFFWLNKKHIYILQKFFTNNKTQKAHYLNMPLSWFLIK